MALSNAERQRRYKERLKAAARGVTPEMVVAAVRLDWERSRAEDPSMDTWEEYLSMCRSRRGRGLWSRNLQGWNPEVFDEKGEELLRNVAEVVQAVMSPPKA
jgi:hypothetical protein